MQKLVNVLENDKGKISLLDSHGYTSLQLTGQHCADFAKLDRSLCEVLATFDFEYITADNTINASGVEKTGFFENLPSKPFYLDSGHPADKGRRLLNPSVCYHCFDHYNRTYQQSTQLVSAAAKCFRNEDIGAFNPFRLCEFTMREFVVIGDAEQVRETGLRIFNAVTRYINELVPVNSVNACDSFMGGNIEVLKKVQKALALKQELVFQTPYGPVSAASVNWHKKTMVSKYIQREEMEECLE